MYKRIQNQFGSAGMILSVVAIVLALGGGAYAANHATASKAKQGKQGKPGKNGTNGTNGTNGAPGATGPAGPAGAPGAKGENGAPGTAGTNGEGVIISAASESECEEGHGGTKFSNASGHHAACNGTTGFTKTLPSEETETGAWFVGPFHGLTVRVTQYYIPISFPIPLASGLPADSVHFVTTGEQTSNTVPAQCEVEGVQGSLENPLAAPGNLCVYQGATKQEREPTKEEHVNFFRIPLEPGSWGAPSKIEANEGETGKTGVVGTTSFVEREKEIEPGVFEPGVYGGGAEAYMKGTWALTAP